MRRKKSRRLILETRFASPIFVFALAIPMVRMNKPIRSFCSPKTCSTLDRIFGLALLARRIASDMTRPFGFLRWTRLTKPGAQGPLGAVGGRRNVAVRHEDEEMSPRSLDHALEFDPNLACRRSPHELIEPPAQPRGISFQGRVAG